MRVTRTLLMRMFGRPRGPLGRLGGMIMAQMNGNVGDWVLDLLKIEPSDWVLEVGFGPGIIVRHLSRQAGAGRVAGIDISEEMVSQARVRNFSAIQQGRVELRHGSVENLPFKDATFDKALSVNSMQVWDDPVEGIKELRRVLKSGGLIALGFTAHSGQTKEDVLEKLSAGGFGESRLVQRGGDFCALATKA
jgi:ubiquinone/menaquinone biosynthesis C-methylase UbiE